MFSSNRHLNTNKQTNKQQYPCLNYCFYFQFSLCPLRHFKKNTNQDIFHSQFQISPKVN